jgi:L-threonylcarbamoyladenylate synthase
LPPFRLRDLVRRLRSGQVIAYPTEAVFGLGCDPVNEAAVRRLLAIKQRPIAKGLILIAADFTQLTPFVEPLDKAQRARVDETWPGPVTWLLPASERVPLWLRGRHDTIAVRVTAHPTAALLCRGWGGALVSTSANLSGRPPARTPLAVRRQLGTRIDCIVAEPVGGSARPSEIRDLRSGRVVRTG